MTLTVLNLGHGRTVELNPKPCEPARQLVLRQPRTVRLTRVRDACANDVFPPGLARHMERVLAEYPKNVLN